MTTVEEKRVVDVAGIQKQVQFYFSDANMQRDNFMQKMTGQDNKNIISYSVLATFNRLKQMGATEEKLSEIFTNFEDDLLQATNEGIRRKQGLKESSDRLQRTLHIKTFPQDFKLEDIEKWSASHQLPQSYISMRYTRERVFKGSCFFAFPTPEECKDALEKLRKDGGAKCGERKLVVEALPAYLQRKNDENTKKKAKQAGNYVVMLGKATGHLKGVKSSAPLDGEKTLLTVFIKSEDFIKKRNGKYKLGEEEYELRLPEPSELSSNKRKIDDTPEGEPESKQAHQE